MPVRIYDISKKLGLENKQILEKAKSMGIAAAKVPSSSLDKISAEWLEEELIKTYPEAAAKLAPKPAPEPPKPAPVEEKIVLITAPPPEPKSRSETIPAPVTGPVSKPANRCKASANNISRAAMEDEEPAFSTSAAKLTSLLRRRSLLIDRFRQISWRSR